MWGPAESRKGHWVPGSWSWRQCEQSDVVLGTGSRSSGRAGSALNHWATTPASKFKFLLICPTVLKNSLPVFFDHFCSRSRVSCIAGWSPRPLAEDDLNFWCLYAGITDMFHTWFTCWGRELKPRTLCSKGQHLPTELHPSSLLLFKKSTFF